MIPAGGMSTSTNDQTSVSSTFGGTSFGAFNVGSGIETKWLVGGAVLIVAVYLFTKGKR